MSTSTPIAERLPRLSAAEPSQGVRRRFADLEGYRGLAALMVVLYHVHQRGLAAQNGADGATAGHHDLATRMLDGLDGFVDLFFVLSAFLLTLPFARAALAPGRPRTPNARSFVLRRAARILPVYLFAVLTVWAFRNPVLPGDIVDLVEHLLFVQVYDAHRVFFTIGPAWSLAVEVQFYVLLLVVGTLMCTLARRIAPHLRFRMLVGIVLGLGVVSVLWRVLAWYVLGVDAQYWPAWFGLQAKLDVFACGMLLAVLSARGLRLTARAGLAWRLVGAGVVVGAILGRPYLGAPHLWFHLVVAVGFALVVAPSALAPSSRWGRVLASPVPVFLGMISYSLYLWYEPVLLALDTVGLLPDAAGAHAVLTGFPILAMASIGVAWVSYHAIERPFGNFRLLLDHNGRHRDYYDGS